MGLNLTPNYLCCQDGDYSLTFNKYTYGNIAWPSGTNWYVTLDGIRRSSTTNQITFSGLSPDIPHSYSISSGDSRFYVSPSSGVYSGSSDKSLSISFISTYTLDFYQSFYGDSQWLSGDTWTININGQQYGPTHNNVIKVSGLNPFTQYSYSVTTSNPIFSLSLVSNPYKFDGTSLEPTITIEFKSPVVVPSGFGTTCTIQPNDPNYNLHPSLYFYQCMGGGLNDLNGEATWDIGNLLILLISAIFIGISAETEVLSVSAQNALSLGINVLSILFNIISLLTGGSSEVNALGSILITLVPYLVTFLINTVLPKLGAWAIVAFTTIITADGLLFSATGGTVYAITVAGQIFILIASTFW